MSDNEKAAVKKPAKPYEPAFRRKESSQGRNILIILIIVAAVIAVAVKFVG
jgi:hypothetical protein